MASNSLIIKFYSKISPDNRGRKLDEIWQQDHVWLEKTHDYIQWLFPLNDKSGFNLHAPILNEQDIETFKDSKELKLNLAHSFQLILDFYGLKFNESHSKITTSESFEERKKTWLHWGNHNHMRITRILKCLQLLGLETYTESFFIFLEQLYRTEKGKITGVTLSHWQEASP